MADALGATASAATEAAERKEARPPAAGKRDAGGDAACLALADKVVRSNLSVGLGVSTEPCSDAAVASKLPLEEQLTSAMSALGPQDSPERCEDAEMTAMIASAATMSLGPAQTTSAAASPMAFRSAGASAADPRTPATRAMHFAADPAAAPPSPALEVLTREKAPVLEYTAHFESSSGVVFKGKIKCDFKGKVFTCTPEPKLESVSKVKIQLSNVKTYVLSVPTLRKLMLTLKEAPACEPSPAAGVVPVKLGTELTLTFLNDASFVKICNEVQKTLVFRPGTFHSDFVVVNNDMSIGTGGNAAVYLVRRRGAPADSISFADKRPLRSGVNLFATEAERLRGCIGCEFITQLVQYYPACEGSPEHLVMEYMEGGDLMNDVLLMRSRVCNPGAPFMSDEEVRIVTWRILRALQYMHDLSAGGSSILHRDIKPDNVFLAVRGSDGCGDCSTAKLADLGHAKELDGVSRTYTAAGVGTCEYMPPEFAAAAQHVENVGHTKALDMWTVGVLIYICFAHEFPYGSAGSRNDEYFPWRMSQLNQKIMRNGLRGMGAEALQELVQPGTAKAALFEQHSAQGRALLQALMQSEPKDRLTVGQALQHPWFAGLEAAEGTASSTP